MDTAGIAELLHPFLAGALRPSQLESILTYIDLLIRWNARVNLTAIRDPDQIVTRHFGESLFAARHLFPAKDHCHPEKPALDGEYPHSDLIDLGSGAGFPGIPIKLWSPDLRVTLIESNQKKATFLREIIRALTLMDIDVFPGRAGTFPARASIVTLRAVERFDSALPVAASLLSAAGRLALLIGDRQLDHARRLVPGLQWSAPLPVPLSSNRILLIGARHSQYLPG